MDGAFTTQKILGESSSLSGYPSRVATLHVHAKPVGPAWKTAKGPEPFCAFCDSHGNWAQDCKRITDTTERVEATESKLVFPLPQLGAYLLKLWKEGNAKCVKCKKSHHRISICDKGSRTKIPVAQTNFTSAGRIEVASPGFTYLQTTQVFDHGAYWVE